MTLAMRWIHALAKALVAILLATLCVALPLYEWAPLWFLKIQLPLTGLILVCYLGKLLYDSLFFDRYQP